MQVFRQQAAAFQIDALFRSQLVDANVSTLLTAPDAIVEMSLQPRRSRAETGSAALYGRAALRINEIDVPAYASG